MYKCPQANMAAAMRTHQRITNTRTRHARAPGVKRWVAYKLSRSTLQHEPKFQKVAARDPVAAAQQLLVHVDEHSTPLLVDL